MSFAIAILTLVMLFFIHYDNKPKEQPKRVLYPILGFNGICIREDIIHELFAKLGKYWDIWYFTYAEMSKSSNIVTYYFRIFEPNVNYDNKRLTRIVKQLTEQIYIRWCQQRDTNIVIDPFIAVVIRGTDLYINIAVNDAGFGEIAELRKQSH